MKRRLASLVAILALAAPLAPMLLAPMLLAPTLLGPVSPALADTGTGPEAAIRGALMDWKDAFNGRNTDRVCDLFSPELRYDVRGLPEQDYIALCNRLHRVLAGRDVGYSYALDIKEIIVSGDLAVVRLTWDLSVSRPGAPVITRPEQGMDVFHRQPDGGWKIIRYIAYGSEN
jgi:steroid delta-isomerase